MHLPRRFAPAVLVAAILGACGAASSDTYDTCAIGVALEPPSGEPGDEIVATGGPFTAPYDTVVRVAGVDAEVLSVERTQCADCDTCRAELRCTSCGPCQGCDDTCTSCVQTVRFFVPEVAQGARDVVLFNRHGVSRARPFKVTRPATQPAETGL